MALMKRKIRIGLDFDGVVAYNPFRIIRGPIKWFKREFLGIKKVSFFVPRNWWQRILWVVVHESSVWPATGVERLRKMAAGGEVEAYLITGRFGLLEDNLYGWLKRNRLDKLFKSIKMNKQSEQPHEFKLKVVKQLDLDIYVEDNLDVVEYLHGKTRTKIYWIYNFLDRSHPYPDKFPYLDEALKKIGS